MADIKPRVAVVHDWLTSVAGAERVVWELHNCFPEAPIFTSVVRPERLTPEFRELDIRTSWLQKWLLATKKHQLYPLLRQMAFESFDLSDYDIVISSSTAESKGVITQPETLHLAYIHTPTRYYWSDYDWYLANPGFGVLDPVVKLVLPRVIGAARRWDLDAAQRPDVLVANSRTVQDRIAKYYGREAQVICPPVDVARFAGKAQDGGYFLAVSRLVPYKRVDLAVAAATKLGLRLKVAGRGSELKSLQKMAGPTVEFITDASDTEITKLYQNCRAFIFTADEDFGITPVEAMAAGKPVVAYGRGGATETVVEGQTGVFFSKQTVESLEAVLEAFKCKDYDERVIRKRAEEFSSEKFRSEIKQYVSAQYARHLAGLVNKSVE